MIRDISIYDYHASDAISASKLQVFHESSLDFFEQFVAKSRAPTSSFSMDFGEAFHALQHSREVFKSCVVPMIFKDFRTDAAKEWRDDMQAQRKLILNGEQMRAIELMDARAKRHKLVASLIDGAEPELTWRHSFGKWTVQSRTDSFNRNRVKLPDGREIGPFWIDWKVCASLRQFRKSWLDLGYARKSLYYSEVISLCEALPDDAPRYPFFWIAIEAEPPHEIQVFELGEKSFPLAKTEIMMDLRRLRRCYETGEWERPETIEIIDYPFYYAQRAERTLLEQRAMLELPA
jgi:hypothetical protein